MKETTDQSAWTILSTNTAAINGWRELRIPANAPHQCFRLTEPQVKAAISRWIARMAAREWLSFTIAWKRT